ncbi:sterol desaturase family protein [Polyangium mundeleinium]|uniref:Sterol desaturase family protein n=1 Tax=Polyangium mundeleinium TaxID=2995306 RepID=A0ABT5ED42_9BACT|nr:sterol desaturase family protein [Polyangium mundeleinium]MDC0739729.1 sterol desaturase family protein [Polyangium mundeleinium]
MPDLLIQASLPELALIVLAFFLGLTIFNVPIGFALERLLPRRRIFDVPLAEGQYRFELVGNLVFLAVAVTTFTAVLSSGLVRFGETSLVRDGLTFFAMGAGFQVYYYFLHRAMHHRALVRFHRWHHRSHVTTPLTGQSMSFVESCAWMIGYAGMPLVMSYVAPIGFWGWAAYLVVNIGGNIVGHANVEITRSVTGIRWRSINANPFVYHALHHARWTGHYSFQSAIMDRLCGTEWKDWPVLLRRVMDGQPLRSLKERADPS